MQQARASSSVRARSASKAIGLKRVSAWTNLNGLLKEEERAELDIADVMRVPEVKMDLLTTHFTNVQALEEVEGDMIELYEDKKELAVLTTTVGLVAEKLFATDGSLDQSILPSPALLTKAGSILTRRAHDLETKAALAYRALAEREVVERRLHAQIAEARFLTDIKPLDTEAANMLVSAKQDLCKLCAASTDVDTAKYVQIWVDLVKVQLAIAHNAMVVKCIGSLESAIDAHMHAMTKAEKKGLFNSIVKQVRKSLPVRKRSITMLPE